MAVKAGTPSYIWHTKVLGHTDAPLSALAYTGGITTVADLPRAPRPVRNDPLHIYVGLEWMCIYQSPTTVYSIGPCLVDRLGLLAPVRDI